MTRIFKPGYRQGAFDGLCCFYSIGNGLSCLFPLLFKGDDVPHQFGQYMARNVRDFPAIFCDGTERPEQEAMLTLAQKWTAERGWPAWTIEGAHPRKGETAEQLWDRLTERVNNHRVPTVALVGFGEDDHKDSRYEPHWSIVERITEHELRMRDSDVYSVVGRHETGIRPEPGWAVEDVFLLIRSRL